MQINQIKKKIQRFFKFCSYKNIRIRYMHNISDFQSTSVHTSLDKKVKCVLDLMLIKYANNTQMMSFYKIALINIYVKTSLICVTKLDFIGGKLVLLLSFK